MVDFVPSFPPCAITTELRGNNNQIDISCSDKAMLQHDPYAGGSWGICNGAATKFAENHPYENGSGLQSPAAYHYEQKQPFHGH